MRRIELERARRTVARGHVEPYALRAPQHVDPGMPTTPSPSPGGSAITTASSESTRTPPIVSDGTRSALRRG